MSTKKTTTKKTPKTETKTAKKAPAKKTDAKPVAPQKADANLIATAPDMLTALQDIRRIIHGRGLSVEKLGRCHAIAEAMILKATGE